MTVNRQLLLRWIIVASLLIIAAVVLYFVYLHHTPYRGFRCTAGNPNC